MDIVPSVTTIGGNESFHTSRPLKAPNKAPAPRDNTSTGNTPASGRARLNSAASIPHSARLAAIERSIPRTRITSIWPSASMMRMAVSSSNPARFAGAAKPGNAAVTATNNPIANTPSVRSRRALSESRGGAVLMRRSPPAAAARSSPRRA
jgi:hypothetical protein